MGIWQMQHVRMTACAKAKQSADHHASMQLDCNDTAEAWQWIAFVMGRWAGQLTLVICEKQHAPLKASIFVDQKSVLVMGFLECMGCLSRRMPGICVLKA